MSAALADKDATFDAQRRRLFGIAYRMLGTVADAEDAVQDTWIRWRSSDRAAVKDAGAFLATAITRRCIDLATSARARRETYIGPWLPEPVPTGRLLDAGAPIAARESISYAFMVLLERLGPLERAVFLLRDVFDYDYPAIAAIVERSEAACRQTLHRARERLTEPRQRFAGSQDERLRLTAAFVRAAGAGDMEAMLSILADDVRATSDGGGKRTAALHVISGADRVARFAIGIARKEPAVQVRFEDLNGELAVVMLRLGSIHGVVFLGTHDGAITEVQTMRNPDKLTLIKPIGAAGIES